MKKELRIVFFGTPDFAVASLKAMLDLGFNVLAVVTAPDRPAGRGQKLQPSAVKSFSLDNGLKVLQPPNLKSEGFVSELKALEANLQVVVAFRMLPEVVWNMPALGTYNVHGSLLPDYRGAAPINWAIVNGEAETGVTTFKLQHAIDTGSILLQKKTEIGPNENAGDLYRRLMALGAEALIESLRLIEEGDVSLRPQPNKITKHAPKIQKQDAKIRWDLSAQQVHDFIRGMNPFPGAFTQAVFDGKEETWKIHETRISEHSSSTPGLVTERDGKLLVGTGDTDLEIRQIQPPGKKRLQVSDFINGHQGLIEQLKFTA